MSPVLVEHLMSTPVVSLFAEQPLPLTEDIMRFKHIRHLPVVDDDGRLVGLVSHRNLLRALISSLTGLTKEQRRARQDEVRVRELMTRDVVCVRADLPVEKVVDLLVDNYIGCLPVVDEDGCPIGMITKRDLVEPFASRARVRCMPDR